MPTVAQLQYIVAVDNLKHFGKAAKECSIAQPSLSMQIQKVEEQIGFLIFDRNRKPIVATEKGKLFIRQAKKVISEHVKLIELSQENFELVSGQFHIGIIPTIMPYLLPKFLESFSESYPKVRLIVDEMKTQDIIDALKDDRIDAGILATPLAEKGIREKVLYYESFHLYVNPNNSLSDHEKLEAKDIKGEDIWLLEDGHCFRNQIANFCSLPRKYSVYSNVTFEGGNLETLRQLVKNGRGYTLVPYLFTQNLSKQEREQMVRDFASPVPTREISLVYSRDQWKKDIIAALFQCIQDRLPNGVSKTPLGNQRVLPITNSSTVKI